MQQSLWQLLCLAAPSSAVTASRHLVPSAPIHRGILGPRQGYSVPCVPELDDLTVGGSLGRRWPHRLFRLLQEFHRLVVLQVKGRGGRMEAKGRVRTGLIGGLGRRGESD